MGRERVLLIKLLTEGCAVLCAGHYVSFIKSSEHWLLLDDELVDVVNEFHVQQAFGTTQEYNSNAEHGYILLYERRESPPA